MSVNITVNLYMMINYTVRALNEAIFPEVILIAGPDGSLSILWQCRLSQIMKQKCPLHRAQQCQYY